MIDLDQQRADLRAAVELLEKLWRAQRDRIAGDPTVRVEPEQVVDDRGFPLLVPMLTAIVNARTALLDTASPTTGILAEQIRAGVEHIDTAYGRGRFGVGGVSQPDPKVIRQEALEDAWRAVHARRPSQTSNPSEIDCAIQYGAETQQDIAESAIRALYVDTDAPSPSDAPCNAKSDGGILCNNEPGHPGLHSWEGVDWSQPFEVELTWWDRLRIWWAGRGTFCHRCDRRVGSRHYRRCPGAKADAEVGAALQNHIAQHPEPWPPRPTIPADRLMKPETAFQERVDAVDSTLDRYRKHLRLAHGVTVGDGDRSWQIREIHQRQHPHLAERAFTEHERGIREH